MNKHKLDEVENNTSNIATKEEPIKTTPDDNFCGHDVFDVDSDTFSKCKLGRMKYSRWKNTLGEGDYPKALKEYIQKAGNKRVVLRDKDTNSMIFFNTHNK